MVIVGFFLGASINTTIGYFRIALHDLDESRNPPIKFSHFIPCNRWDAGQNNLYTVDRSNGDVYLNDSPKVKRLKCLALVVATPIVQAVGLLLNVANRVAKLMTLSHFWYADQSFDGSFKDRLFTFCTDVLRVACTLIFYVGLELSAVYGLMRPNDGGKLYATFERCAYGRHLLAPCFQPSPTSHLGGGDLRVANSW